MYRLPKKIEVIFKTNNESERNVLEKNAKILDKLSNVEKYTIDNEREIPKLTGFRLADNTEIFVPLAGLIDTEKETAKLKKDIEKTETELKESLANFPMKNSSAKHLRM